MMWAVLILALLNLVTLGGMEAARADRAIADKNLRDLRARLPDIRQAEVDRFSNWSDGHDPRNFLDYAHQRGAEIDETRGGDV